MVIKMARISRRLTVGAAATILLAGIGGVALAASGAAASSSGTTINGCYNTTTGALRVLTPRNRTCRGEHKISWNQTGNGYNFVHTAGALNDFHFHEADGPFLEQSGDYYVVVQANVDISGLSAATPVTCFLDLVRTGPSWLYRLYSSFTYAFPGTSSPFGPGQYPNSLTGVVHVPPAWAKTQLYMICQSAGGTTQTIESASWWVSPVHGTSANKVSISTAGMTHAEHVPAHSSGGGFAKAG